ncbi:MAG: hypothetical protein PF488_01075 [Patescibacteria group bacterium]|jgi:hypothetical protein|nr:hypothetical protein [Patescibacteria group bacterium]
MLNKLFGSDQKIKILTSFFQTENSGYLSREIAKQLDQKGPSIKRDLLSLVDLGILKLFKIDENGNSIDGRISDEGERGEKSVKEINASTKKKAKKPKIEEKYYLNTEYLLYPELKSLFEKINFLANQEVFDKIVETCKPKIFVLVGKFVNDFDSPIDILIVGDFNKKKFQSYVTQLEKIINEEINYTVLTEEEYFYRQTISDIFLYQVMERKKITLCG